MAKKRAISQESLLFYRYLLDSLPWLSAWPPTRKEFLLPSPTTCHPNLTHDRLMLQKLTSQKPPAAS